MANFHTFKYLNEDASTCIDLGHVYRIEPADDSGYGVRVWIVGRETSFEFGGPWDVWMKMLNGEDGPMPKRPNPPKQSTGSQ